MAVSPVVVRATGVHSGGVDVVGAVVVCCHGEGTGWAP